MVLTAGDIALTIGARTMFDRVSFGLEAGDMALVTGPPGSGKTALGLASCGLAGFLDSEAVLSGSLNLFGTPVVQGRYRSEAGIVFDNPYVQVSGMTRTVAGELGFPLECRGVPGRHIAGRVDRMLDLLDIGDLAGRDIGSLSGGELQRVIVGACLIVRPSFLFLDRPLTEVDAAFRHDLLDLFASHIVQCGGAALLAEDPWLMPERTFPLTVRLDDDTAFPVEQVPLPSPRDNNEAALTVDTLTFTYPGGMPLLTDISFTVPSGSVIVLEGANGAGKTTLAKLAAGILRPVSGTIRIGGRDTASLAMEENMSLVGFAPQNPDVVLCRKTVRDELALAAKWGNDPAPVTGVLGLDGLMDRHPLELTRAAKKRLGVALAYGPRRRVIFLDEPSQYQDGDGFMRVMRAVAVMAGNGVAVVIVSHDPRVGEALPEASVIRLSRADRH